MVDVDRLKEAVDNTLMDDDGVVHQSRHRGDQAAILEAARLLVAGQPLWWCEEHKSSLLDANSLVCDLYLYVVGHPILPCRMVEGWWFPTGGEK